MKEFKPTTVAELIHFLQQQPQYLTVAYMCCSEQTALELDDIEIIEGGGGVMRPDGWIPNQRPDKLPQKYLLFPGN
jgi:hypothetical protein